MDSRDGRNRGGFHPSAHEIIRSAWTSCSDLRRFRASAPALAARCCSPWPWEGAPPCSSTLPGNSPLHQRRRIDGRCLLPLRGRDHAPRLDPSPPRPAKGDGSLLPRERGKHEHPRQRGPVARQGGVPGVRLRLSRIRNVRWHTGYPGGEPGWRRGAGTGVSHTGRGRRRGRRLRPVPRGGDRNIRRRQLAAKGGDQGRSIIESAFAGYRRIVRDKLIAGIITLPLAWPASWTVEDGYSPERWIGSVAPVPVVVIHGTKDPVVPFSHGERLYRLAGQPKGFWKVEGGGHATALLLPDVRTQLLGFLDSVLPSSVEINPPPH